MSTLAFRLAASHDIEQIRCIYNQGIEDRVATLETEPKDRVYMEAWFQEHQGRYRPLVVETNGKVVGWASLNPYSHRCAYNGVADLSIYIKIVLFTFSFNVIGQRLYRRVGYREVGVFERQGLMDHQYIDMMIMEKIL